MELSSEPTNLVEEAREIAELFEAKAEETGIALQVEVSSKPLWALADRGALRIVLQNLVSNALKYTERGGTVWVRARKARDAALLEVEDTGIGMSPEKVESLFDPFRQESEGVDRKYEGSGLGLAVAREATHRMKGTIEVETEKGVGSCFTVQLPCTDAPTAA